MNNYDNLARPRDMRIQNEKKVLVGSIQKFSTEDGPGIRSTVFLKGCPLNCSWCHNPELIELKQQLIKSPNNCIGCGHCMPICPEGAISISKDAGVSINRDKCTVCLKCADDCFAQALRPVATEMTTKEILHLVDQDKGFYKNTGGGLTISGGELLTHGDFVARLIDEAAELGINVCLDTSGFGSGQLLMELAKKSNVTDILYDMKSIDDKVHMEYTGVSNRLIIDNLRSLMKDKDTSEKVTVRMPLVSGINDTRSIIEETVELYAELGIKKLTLLPYHNLGISKMRNIGGAQAEFAAPKEEWLQEIANIFKSKLAFDPEIPGKI